MEKFPKATLEYFELLVAKLRGVFNNEINKLKSDSRSHQAQVESLNRIIREQENLLD
jgi:chromosome segregation ATPase